jgi:hypothetical protein
MQATPIQHGLQNRLQNPPQPVFNAHFNLKQKNIALPNRLVVVE